MVKTEDIEKRMERLNKYIKVVDDAMEQMMTQNRVFINLEHI